MQSAHCGHEANALAPTVSFLAKPGHFGGRGDGKHFSEIPKRSEGSISNRVIGSSGDRVVETRKFGCGCSGLEMYLRDTNMRAQPADGPMTRCTDLPILLIAILSRSRVFS